MSKKKMSPKRRKFLKSAAAGGMATLVGGTRVMGSTPPPAPRQTATAMILPEESDPSGIDVRTTDRPGADFMLDVIKSLGLEYIASNPGSSFRALQESIATYGGNKNPEFLTCCHEESSVAMAHGYATIEGKPMGVLAHATVGLQHAAMAIYNAYCDRVPVYLMLGNSIDATTRRPGAEWVHSVIDAAAMVRDYIKWDDLPISLGHFAESAVRGYKYAMTPPMMPVVLVLDHELQERPVPEHANLRIPRLTIPTPPQGDSGAVHEVARLLVEAENPVIVAGRVARTPAGMARLIELAETLQAPVVNQWQRTNFPSRHPLASGSGSLAGADVILGLELNDYWGTVNSLRDQLHRTESSKIRPDAKLISITTGDLYMQGNYQDMQRFLEVDLALAADAEATLPSLIEAVKHLLTDDRRTAFEERGRQLAERKQQSLAAARRDATYAWDAQSHQHRPCRRRAVAPNQGRGLVAGIESANAELMADAAVGLRQALSGHRRLGCSRPRLRCTGRGGRRTREPQVRPPIGERPVRRRLDVRSRRLVDRGASQDSTAECHAQQPCLSSGGHASAAHGQPPPARHHECSHRHDHR